MGTTTLVFGDIIKTSCMLLFAAFSVSHHNSLCPNLPFQQNYIYLICCKREGKAGSPCHAAASGFGSSRDMKSTWACWGVGGELVSTGEQLVQGHFQPTGDVTPVSPVSDVTAMAFSRVLSPIWWLSCIIFLCVCPCVFFRDFSSSVLANGEREGQGA